jgi:hypothetical protein
VLLTAHLHLVPGLRMIGAIYLSGVRGGAVGWGTALQTGRSRVRFPMESLEFFSDNPSDRIVALGSTQPLTNEYQEFFLGVKTAGA